MKVFISWSGDQSKQCAELLRDWIKCALQASDPWISSKDIDKGTIWFNEITDQLQDTKIGIICVTSHNKEAPWILFESGALAKGLSSNKVCPLLIDLDSSDLKGPLAQFNHTLPNEESMKGLLATINNELGDNALPDRVFDQVFETYWPQFKDAFQKIKPTKSTKAKPSTERSENDLLREILDTTRTMDKRVRRLENELSHSNANLLHSALKNLADTQPAFKNSKYHTYSEMLSGKDYPIDHDRSINPNTYHAFLNPDGSTSLKPIDDDD